MIIRLQQKNIEDSLNNGKAIVIMGARQTGKTTMLMQMFPENEDNLWLNGDEIDVQSVFENVSADRLRGIIGNHKVLVIDEAQRIKDIGLRLKLITDKIPEVQLVATGSSSFDLSNKVNEPLTGRKWEFRMFPLSFAEMVNHNGLLTEKRMIPHRMVYGYYPEVVTSVGKERDVLRNLADSYLYRDVLSFGMIKKSDKLVALLKALAYQVGSQVSYNELAELVGIDAKTIDSYIQILEKSYIVFRLQSYARNMRNELKFSKKIYFYDNGLRNAIISDFSQVENRADVGALWENFLISERVKFAEYNKYWANRYFWRTREQKEIDLLEEYDGKLYAYEFKYSASKCPKAPLAFRQNYPNATFSVITSDNVESFLLS